MRHTERVVFFKQKTAYEIRPRDWSSDVCSSDLCREDRVGVDRLALPPLLRRRQDLDREVEMRRVRRRVAGRADVAEDVAAMDFEPFADARRVAVEMRVVVAALRGPIEFVQRDPARAAA